MKFPFTPLAQHHTENVFCPICGSRLERDWHEDGLDHLLETASCPSCGLEETEDRECASLYGLPSAREKLVSSLYAKYYETYFLITQERNDYV